MQNFILTCSLSGLTTKVKLWPRPWSLLSIHLSCLHKYQKQCTSMDGIIPYKNEGMQFEKSLHALVYRMQKTSRHDIHFLALWRESTRLLHSFGHFWGGFCLTVATAALGFSPFAAKWFSPLFCILTSNFSLLPAASQPRQKQQLREQTKIQQKCWLLSLTVLYLHTSLVSLVGIFCRGFLWFHWLRHGPQQSAVEVRHEEAWVGVLLHEAVDDSLGIVEAHRGGRLNVPSDHVSGFVVYVDLAKRKDLTSPWTNSRSRKVIESDGVRSPLSQPRPECNVWRSSWPCRTSERRTWSSCSPRTLARIRCSRRWTLT